MPDQKGYIQVTTVKLVVAVVSVVISMAITVGTVMYQVKDEIKDANIMAAQAMAQADAAMSEAKEAKKQARLVQPEVVTERLNSIEKTTNEFSKEFKGFITDFRVLYLPMLYGAGTRTEAGQ